MAETITLLPSAKRAAYFPRTPWLKSYSGFISGSGTRSSSLLIELPLGSGREGGARGQPDNRCISSLTTLRRVSSNSSRFWLTCSRRASLIMVW